MQIIVFFYYSLVSQPLWTNYHRHAQSKDFLDRKENSTKSLFSIFHQLRTPSITHNIIDAHLNIFF